MLELTVLPGEYAVCRAAEPFSVTPSSGRFVSLTATPEEFSAVLPVCDVPAGVAVEAPWRVLKVCGVLDFSLIGILAGLTAALAAAKISVFAVSTYDTDYLLVKAERLAAAAEALTAAGYNVRL